MTEIVEEYEEYEEYEEEEVEEIIDEVSKYLFTAITPKKVFTRCVWLISTIPCYFFTVKVIKTQDDSV